MVSCAAQHLAVLRGEPIEAKQNENDILLVHIEQTFVRSSNEINIEGRRYVGEDETRVLSAFSVRELEKQVSQYCYIINCLDN